MGTARELIAGIETGGTKIVCRVVDAAGAVVAEGRFATTTPEAAVEDLASCIGAADGRLTAIGLASFGPLVVDPASPDWGVMLPTPKIRWSGFNLRAALVERLGAPVALDTDVGAAAIAEQAMGAARGCETAAYVTVGTGIGGALAVSGQTMKGAVHAEIGHLRLHRVSGDHIPSACGFHDDCAEGLAAGPAIGVRLRAGERLENRADVRVVTADYLGQLCAALVLAWSPQCIVMGGGVMSTPGLLDEVASALRHHLGDYGARLAPAEGFLRPAALEHAGLEGALMLARGLAARA